MELADPLYEIPVKCPVCYTGPIKSYRLKSKCQTITVDELTIPSYTGVRGHADADLLEMAPTVCSRCLYSSTQSDAFTRLGGLTASEEVVLRESLQEALLLSSAVRKEVISRLGLTVADFDRPRQPKAVYAAYQLTAWTAAIKAQQAMKRALSEIATAHLYSYVFANKCLGEAVSQNALEKAAKAYGKVFETGDHDPKSIDQVLYLCIALHLRLGWREEAKPFVVAFERLRDKARMMGSEDLKRLQVYQERIADLWQMSS